MDRGYRGRRRRTVGEQWRAYGARPPVSRWVSRGSLVVGVAIGIVLLLVAAVLVAKVLCVALVWVLFKA